MFVFNPFKVLLYARICSYSRNDYTVRYKNDLSAGGKVIFYGLKLISVTASSMMELKSQCRGHTLPRCNQSPHVSLTQSTSLRTFSIQRRLDMLWLCEIQRSFRWRWKILTCSDVVKRFSCKAAFVSAVLCVTGHQSALFWEAGKSSSFRKWSIRYF